MVVVASMIGAGGLGEYVLSGIQRLDIGIGFEGGLGVVLLAIVAGVVGQHFQLSTTVISNPLPGSDPQGLHTDDGMFPVSKPHMPMLCNSLLALDDITVANGGTWYRPIRHSQPTQRTPAAPADF
jgi:ectoine hydroxylase-related dioxygenase (phytanoyl-CoA dioxygenase family)